MQQVAVSAGVRYSGRVGRPSPQEPAQSSSTQHASPVWPLAGLIFATAFLFHDLKFAVGVVLAQLAIMTALQWLALWAQTKALKSGAPRLGSLALLRGIRLGTFWLAIAYTIIA